jgi:antirestriction protein ArdC
MKATPRGACSRIGSAFLSCGLNLTPEVREDHASYIASWIKVLKEDKRAIFSAASHAQRAVSNSPPHFKWGLV